MDESSSEEGHPDRDVDDVPDCQHAACARQSGSLDLPGRGLDLDTLQGARDLGVDVSTDEPADDDDDGQESGGTGQAVEFPGRMKQHEIGANQAGEDVELEPGGHAPPAGGAAALADGIQDFGEQHEDKSQDTQQVTEKSAGRGYLPGPKNDKGIDSRNPDDRQE